MERAPSDESRPPILAAALRALSGCRHSLAEAEGYVPDAPGLYAIFGSSEVWVELGLEAPPDERPLYLGKSESSLAQRDLKTHFADGRTGSSTVRRSFAALLRDSHGFRGLPRNPERPERPANFGLAEADDVRLTTWMRSKLELACWPKPGVAVLTEVERGCLAALEPPLNLKDVQTPWTAQVRSARRQMADDARSWIRGENTPYHVPSVTRVPARPECAGRLA